MGIFDMVVSGFWPLNEQEIHLTKPLFWGVLCYFSGVYSVSISIPHPIVFKQQGAESYNNQQKIAYDDHNSPKKSVRQENPQNPTSHQNQ